MSQVLATDLDEDVHALYITEEGNERLSGGGITKGTWRNWRSAGKGPPFYRVGGRVLYKRSEVVEWIEAHRVLPECV